MEKIKIDKYIQLSHVLACIECGQEVTYLKINEGNGLFYCNACKNINLLEKNIIVCLPKEYEIKYTYWNFYKTHTNFLEKNRKIKNALKKIIQSLPEKRRSLWEDEDVSYWNKLYANARKISGNAKMIEEHVDAVSGLRLYTREKYLFRTLQKIYKKNSYVLEIGCGMAQTVKRIFSPLSYDYTYIASDYSHNALTYLQKTFGKRNNVIYIQCLGNRLPFKASSLDSIICLGVLHHMPQKEMHLKDIIHILRKHGLLVLNEVYLREYQLPDFFMRQVEKFIEPQHSAHEERVNWKKMKSILSTKGTMLVEHHEYSPTRTLLVRLFNNQIEHSIIFTKLCLLLDELTIKTIGKMWKLFDAGACLIVYKKGI